MEMIRESANKIITNNSSIKLIDSGDHAALVSYYNKLEYDYGCTYVFYIYEDIIRDKKIIYTSNWEWQDRLIGEKLINECPIIKAGTEAFGSGKKSIILPWNDIHCKTSLEKEITLYRNEFNISNGIGISHTNGIVREGVGLGADINDPFFYRRMLSNHTIYHILKRFRQLAFKLEKFPSIH